MSKRMVFLVVLPILLLGVTWIGIRGLNSFAQPSHDLGVHNGSLADCPDSPNCVSTHAGDTVHGIEPFPLKDSADATIHRIAAILEEMPHSRIVSLEKTYLHAEFRSPVLGFVDDVEVSIDEENNLVHLRSASRVGHSDLGANRRRAEEIRRRLESSDS